jgi:hypothetical protein
MSASRPPIAGQKGRSIRATNTEQPICTNEMRLSQDVQFGSRTQLPDWKDSRGTISRIGVSQSMKGDKSVDVAQKMISDPL